MSLNAQPSQVILHTNPPLPTQSESTSKTLLLLTSQVQSLAMVSEMFFIFAHQEVVSLHVTMQGLLAVHTLERAHNLCQDHFCLLKAEHQAVAVRPLETSCCLPAWTQVRLVW